MLYFSTVRILLFRSKYKNYPFHLNSNLCKYAHIKNIEIQFLTLWPSFILIKYQGESIAQAFSYKLKLKEVNFY